MEGTKVLIVSDSGYVRRAVNGLLDHNHFALDIISYAELDQSSLQKKGPDVILLDCDERSSICINTLNLIRNHSEVPVIVLLDENATINTVNRFDGLSADGFLSKPLIPNLLESYINARLRRILQFNARGRQVS